MVGGGVSGVAADTSASEEQTSTTHPLTYIPPPMATTESLDDTIDELVSGIVSTLISDPDQVGDDIREGNSIIDQILTVFTNFIDTIINALKLIGDKIANW
jgi:hypothetical protein